MGCFAAGVVFAAMSFGVLETCSDRAFAFCVGFLGVVAFVGLNAYWVFGLLACIALLRVRSRRGEPRGLREQRTRLLTYVFFFPILWLFVAFVGIFVIRLFEYLACLVIPANALLLGLPIALARAWVSGVCVSMTRDRAARRVATRKASRVWMWIWLWFIGAVVASVVPFILEDDRTLVRTFFALAVLVGGLFAGVIALEAALAARREYFSLRSTVSVGERGWRVH